MKRTNFLKGLFASSIFASISKASFAAKVTDNDKLKLELLVAWERSRVVTMGIIEQMPEEHMGFKYTPEAMSFAEQFRHCTVFSFMQFAAHLGFKNPYEKARPKVLLSKAELVEVTALLYDNVRTWLTENPADMLQKEVTFSGEAMPAWRLFYAMENHVIHHRGQAVVYLRLKGVTPKSYFGW
jgi:hypothetical protein